MTLVARINNVMLMMVMCMCSMCMFCYANISDVLSINRAKLNMTA